MPTHQRTAFITGAARGIGLAAAQSLLGTGKRVLLLDREPVALEHFPEEHHKNIRRATLDVTDAEGIAEALEATKAAWGPVGILVNNAGISPKRPDGTSSSILQISSEEWERVVSVNLTSAFRICQLVTPHMQELGWGRIINLSSLAGRTRSRVAGVSYSATKTAVIGLSRTLANELGPFGVTCNCVAPGRILTEMALQGGDEINRAYAEAIPVKRLGTPDEVARVISFLASEDTGFINGAVIDINGGFFMP